MRFAAGILSKTSYIPSIGRQTSFSATRISVGTSRRHLNASLAGRIPGLGFELPAGASAITAPMHYVGRDERCRAAKAAPDPSYRGESELRFSQNVVKKESNVRNGSRWRLRCARPAVQEFRLGRRICRVARPFIRIISARQFSPAPGRARSAQSPATASRVRPSLPHRRRDADRPVCASLVA